MKLKHDLTSGTLAFRVNVELPYLVLAGLYVI